MADDSLALLNADKPRSRNCVNKHFQLYGIKITLYDFTKRWPAIDVRSHDIILYGNQHIHVDINRSADRGLYAMLLQHSLDLTGRDFMLCVRVFKQIPENQ